MLIWTASAIRMRGGEEIRPAVCKFSENLQIISSEQVLADRGKFCKIFQFFCKLTARPCEFSTSLTVSLTRQTDKQTDRQTDPSCWWKTEGGPLDGPGDEQRTEHCKSLQVGPKTFFFQYSNSKSELLTVKNLFFFFIKDKTVKQNGWNHPWWDDNKKQDASVTPTPPTTRPDTHLVSSGNISDTFQT